MAASGATLAAAAVECARAQQAPVVFPTPALREASYYETLKNKVVQCGLCPWRCTVVNGRRGTCGVRENRNGTYYTLVYGRPVAMNNDPIEKKPFFHVYPGSRAFSIATVGCNFKCKFCQNWDISQARPEDIPAPFRSPREIAQRAAEAGCKTIAYTYSEPTIYYEYMADCARAAKEFDIGNVVVSNGSMNEKPLKDLIPLLTAMKVDFKSFSQKFYEDICENKLSPVLDTLKRLAGSGLWFEIVVLIIPTLNDSMDEIKQMADWIVKELGPNVPLHFTRFHPTYKLRNLPQTPPEILFKARQLAMEHGCHFVYTGNMPGQEGEHTYCPNCKAVVLSRYGHMTISPELASGKCHKCGTAIPGIWVSQQKPKAGTAAPGT
jgi:pyruvate formate lyase activating enzyme